MAQGSWKKLRENATTNLTGDFPVEVVKATHGESSNKNPMVKVQLKVTAGPFAGRVIFHNFVLSDNQFVQRKFFTDLAVLGADDAFFDQEPSMDMLCSQIMGRQAVVTVEPREWNGEMRENVTAFKAATGPFVSTAGSTDPFATGVTVNAAPVKAEPTVASGETPPDDPF